jgi:hypothetical protein
LFRLWFAVDAALAHPYLEHLHDPQDVPVASQPFRNPDTLAGAGNQGLSVDAIQKILYKESMSAWR